MTNWNSKSLVYALSLVGVCLLMVGASLPAQASPLMQLTPFPTPTAGPDGKIYYIVQEGDTLWRIAAIAGISVDQLRALNKLGLDQAIVPGQKLLIGLGGPVLATPVPGEAAPTPTQPVPTASPKPGWGIICVLLYNDQNGDSLRQNTEPSIPGGAISVSDQAGSVSKAAETTDGSDPICFEELLEGAYNVSVAIPQGYNPTTVMNRSVKLSAGYTIQLRFGAQPTVEKSEELQVIPSEPISATTHKSPILGIVGGLILLAGVVLGVYAALLKRVGK